VLSTIGDDRHLLITRTSSFCVQHDGPLALADTCCLALTACLLCGLYVLLALISFFLIFLEWLLGHQLSQNLLYRASNATELSASGEGRLCPWPPPGLCPLTPTGGSVPDPYIGSCSRARHDQAQGPPPKKTAMPWPRTWIKHIIFLGVLHMHKATRATFMCTIQYNC